MFSCSTCLRSFGDWQANGWDLCNQINISLQMHLISTVLHRSISMRYDEPAVRPTRLGELTHRQDNRQLGDLPFSAPYFESP